MNSIFDRMKQGGIDGQACGTKPINVAAAGIADEKLFDWRRQIPVALF
jgi:hypothetical protein